jgi:hypothetical protein
MQSTTRSYPRGDTVGQQQHLLDSLRKFEFHGMHVPEHDHGGLVRYLSQGVPPGDFLTAVLQNDLREALGRADDTNMHALPAIVAWLYNNAAAGSWGSRERFDDWIKMDWTSARAG